jgi:drug/metabolite transporter (DMT)-like permease
MSIVIIIKGFHMLSIISLYALYASSFTLGKAILGFVQPVFFIGVRMLASGLLLLGYQYFFNRTQWRFSWKDWFWYLQIMIFQSYFSYVGEFVALSWGVSSGKDSFFFTLLSPFFTALLSYYMATEIMTSKKWLGLCIGLVGFLPLLLAQPMAPDDVGTWWHISFGELLLIGAVLSAAYSWIIMKKLVDAGSYSPIMINGIGMAGGGFMALIHSLCSEKAPYFTFAMPANDTLGQVLLNYFSNNVASIILFFLYFGLLIVVTNIIFNNAYGFLLRRYSATFLSLAGVTTPLFTAAWGWLLLGEKIGWSFVLSMVITSVGLFIFYQEELRGTNVM